jgi:general stress protein YciG
MLVLLNMLQRSLCARAIINRQANKEEVIMAASNRGLASADESTRKRVASQGGKASGGNFKKDSARASAAGKLGAAAQSREDKAKGGRNSHRGA